MQERATRAHRHKQRRSAPPEAERRSAAADRDRSRPWRHRQRHQVGLDGQDEKDVVLAFGLKLRDRLEKTGKYRVAMTRSDDTFIPLNERVRFARAAQGRAVHLDPCRLRCRAAKGRPRAPSVYTLSDHASDAEAARLAEAENKSDIIAGVDLSAEPDDVANILIDLAQRETKAFSVQFARDGGRRHQAGRRRCTCIRSNRPASSCSRRRTCPRCWSNSAICRPRRDLKNLTSPDWRAHTADSHGAGGRRLLCPAPGRRQRAGRD